MQDVKEAQDKLRQEVKDLRGGYTAIGKILGVNKASVHNALDPENTPRLETLERIGKALEQVKIERKVRLSMIVG